MYDARLARMFSIDPRSFEYPWQSPYVYHRNSPIAVIDFMGGGDDDPPVEEEKNVTTGFGNEKVGTQTNQIELETVYKTVYIEKKSILERTKIWVNDFGNKLKGGYNSWKKRTMTIIEEYWSKFQKEINELAEVFSHGGGEPENQNTVTPRYNEHEGSKAKIQVKKDKDVQERWNEVSEHIGADSIIVEDNDNKKVTKYWKEWGEYPTSGPINKQDSSKYEDLGGTWD